MKIVKITLWILAFITFFIGFTLLIIEIKDESKSQLPGMILMFITTFLFILVFMIDAIKVMVFSKTAGDAYSIMSKEELMRVLMARGIEYKEDKPKAYYQTLCRESDEEKDKHE